MAHPVRPRRKDRAVDVEAWIQRMLRDAPVGVLAVNDDGAPYVNPNLFVHDGETRAIYLHGSAQGRLPGLTREPRPAAFTVYTMGHILPASRAFEFSTEYASVVAFGPVDQVDEEAEMRRILLMFMDKYAPHLEYGVDYEGIRPTDLPLTAVHRLRIEQWSAKRNEVEEGAPTHPYKPPGAPQS